MKATRAFGEDRRISSVV